VTKDFRVEPNQGAILNYFSVDLHQMDTIKHLRTAILEVCKKNTSAFEMFYLFGATDVLLLGISDTCDTLRKMQEAKPYQKIRGVMDYFAHYGTILSVHPTPFGFNDALRKNKILGIINWKIRHEVWLELFQTHDSLVKIRNSFAGLISTICERSFKKSLKKARNNLEYNVASILSSGCEDIILVVLTNSLQLSKFLSTEIRSIEFKDLIPSHQKKSDIRHVTVSTYTVLGARIKKGDFIYEYPKQAVGKQVQDRLRWDSCFNVRPGHLRNAIDTIKNNGPKSLIVEPIAGRPDLIVYTGHDKTHTSVQFLQLHHHLIKALKDSSSILSSETHFSFPDLRRSETANIPAIGRHPLPVMDEIKKLNKDIYNSRLHILEQESFAQIVRKLQYLLGDRYLMDSFMTLTPVIFKGVRQYIKLKETPSKITPESELWTSLIELCFAARYKGSPTIGETAVSPTLGDYSTGEKYLTLLDLLSNRIVKSIITKCSAFDLKPLYVVNISVNSSSATCIPTMPIQTAFILLPPRPLFYLQFLLLTFSHELGHVVFNSFALSVGSKLPREVNNWIKAFREPMAEYFSIKMLSNLNFAKHKQIIQKVFEDLKMSQDSYTIKCNHIDKAEFFYEIAKYPFGESIIRDIISRKIREQNKDTKKLGDPIKFSAKALVDYIKFLDSWDDEIIHKVRNFFVSQNAHEEFWNLWIYLYTLGEQCYIGIR
jgi:hypothetical protein